jgi:hypothetical protein
MAGQTPDTTTTTTLHHVTSLLIESDDAQCSIRVARVDGQGERDPFACGEFSPSVRSARLRSSRVTWSPRPFETRCTRSHDLASTSTTGTDTDRHSGKCSTSITERLFGSRKASTKIATRARSSGTGCRYLNAAEPLRCPQHTEVRQTSRPGRRGSAASSQSASARASSRAARSSGAPVRNRQESSTGRQIAGSARTLRRAAPFHRRSVRPYPAFGDTRSRTL